MRYLLLSAAFVIAAAAFAVVGVAATKFFDAPCVQPCPCGCQQTGVCDCGE